jgi:hypothetical protein
MVAHAVGIIAHCRCGKSLSGKFDAARLFVVPYPDFKRLFGQPHVSYSVANRRGVWLNMASRTHQSLAAHSSSNIPPTFAIGTTYDR